MSVTKGKKKALAALRKCGKAALYENKTWKFMVMVVLCSDDEMKAVIEENVKQGSKPIDATGLSGLSMDAGNASASRGSRSYMMWVNTGNGMKAIGALAHEAVHIAGMALSDCGVPCDIEDVGESECVAYLVEDIVNFAVDRMAILGLVSGKQEEEDDEHA